MNHSAGWFPPPFGPLNGIHARVLAAKPLTWDPVDLFVYWIMPLLPVVAQAWLLLGPQSNATRLARGALAGVAVVLSWNAWVGYRLVDPAYNAFNLALTMFHIHHIINAIEFALLSHGIVDPWMKKGRGRLQASVDLVANTRLIFLGDVGLDEGTKPNASVSDIVVERHLEHLKVPSQSRCRAISRHLAWAAILYLIDHTFFSFIKDHRLATLGVAGDHVLETFTTSTIVRVPYLGTFSPGALHIFVQVVVFVIIWASLSLCFHVAAVLGLLAGWEVETWSVNLMQPPWAAESLTELWGRRWHQCLRHHLIIVSASVCHILHLPCNRATMVPLVFFFSAGAHVLAGLNMTPVPTSWKVGAFFLLNGVGCFLEYLFTAFTGRRVGGPLGRIWFIISLLAMSKMLCEAWLDAGMAGNQLLPVRGPGEYIVSWILDFVQVYPKNPA